MGRTTNYYEFRNPDPKKKNAKCPALFEDLGYTSRISINGLCSMFESGFLYSL